MTIDTTAAAHPDPRHRTPGRQVIAASWRRSALSGIRPDRDVLPAPVDISSADPLLDAARPVLDDAASRIVGSEMSLLLVDHECRMVSRVTGGTTIERALDGAGAASGVPFGEAAVGTTALGTPAEIRRGVMVNSSEHYLEKFKRLSCFGQPIIHPATRRLVGSLCMTEVADNTNPLAVPFVNGIVADIADRLLDRSRSHQRRVLDAFQRAAPRRDVAVAAIGDDIQLTNTLAAELLCASDFGALRAVVADPALHPTTLSLTLTGGTGVEILVEPVAGTHGAALFHLRPLTVGATSTPTPTRPASVAAGIAITGEPGTGRSTTARALAADLGGGHRPPIVVDIADALIDGTAPDIAAVLARCRAESVALVVDGAELLDDRSLTLLRHAAGRATPAAPVIVVTGPPAQLGAGAAALIGHCPRRVDLPPLRQRSTELAAIASGIVADLAPDTALSSGATDCLLSQEWLGNLTELVSVLDEAVATCRSRSARTIEVADLPERYRTTSRAAHLAGREQAERQAIIDALERCSHNKVQAARELGISRTTLYARMRALGI
ncbi:sigma-54-dependent Fis family transcriptional regulator [Gordonia polyisoprenivorans]|uniref:sigma-54-dependent Fis family transcriptional regulator n=1 Tax=Gordonia polyisoprenivorans TaxID=84595 RepID=UPI0030D124E5